jgi:hypothetical protein
MSFLTEMNRRDAMLAGMVRETTDRLAQTEAEVVRARQIVELRKRRRAGLPRAPVGCERLLQDPSRG